MAEARGFQARAQRAVEVAVAERQGELGVAAECRDHAQFRVGQGVEAIQPDGADAASAFALDPFRGAHQPPRA